MGITHATVAVGTDAGTGEIHKAEWNADHVVTALPTVVAVGTSATSAAGNITPGLPTGHALNDILLIFCQTSNQTLTAPTGYTQCGPQAGFGTAASAGSTRLIIFWKRDGGSESAQTITGAADHTLGQIMAVRGCPTTGDPFLCVGTSKPKRTASVTGTATAGATPIDNCLVVNAWVTSLDSASTAFSSFTNADLGSVTEQIDVATADGNGGGIGVCTGTKATSGNFAATTVTETSTTDVSVTFIMLPAGILGRAGFIDRQVFVTAGFADTWTRPTAAKMVNVTAIGGGSSGSGGRNASVAAGGGGGGGGMWKQDTYDVASLPASTATVTAGTGGAATANSDGAASNTGAASTFAMSAVNYGYGQFGGTAGASATGSGGLGGSGGGFGTAAAAGAQSFGSQSPGGGTGGTTGAAGGSAQNQAGGAGGGGGTTQAGTTGGSAQLGGAGGGGGRSNTNFSTGGAGFAVNFAGGASVGAAGTDSTSPLLGAGGGASGNSATGPGGAGGWPGGGGGGGGSQSGAQRGGAGADGVVTVVTICG